jgi:hypothetical protein
MKKTNTSPRQTLGVLSICAAALLMMPVFSYAQEREDLEKLRATVLALVETLVKNGLLSSEQADAMMKDAQNRANTRLTQLPPPATNADGKKVVRVPYIPESVKTQMREEIKAEVLAQTKTEVVAETKLAQSSLWGSGSPLHFEGDLRLREEMVRLDNANTGSVATTISGPMVSRGLTRVPDATIQSGDNASTFNPQENYDRQRIRARLSVLADVAENLQAVVGVATGGSSGPTSTNVTLGQGADKTGSYFNRYSVSLDRAFMRYRTDFGVSVLAGRFNNPFMKTDLVWAEDLNMDGVAASNYSAISPTLSNLTTVGCFPLSTNKPNTSYGKSLFAAQTGVDWQFGVRDDRLKLAGAIYYYDGIEAGKETDAGAWDYLSGYEYGSNYRQRGNTLVLLNRSTTQENNEAGKTFSYTWGLASRFQELDLNAQLDLSKFDPLHLRLNANFVKNLGFSRSEIFTRTGYLPTDGKDYGFLLRAQVGAPTLKQLGDWNVSAAYRYLGSDAVLDAFTDSDFGLGGTNSKGFVLGGGYGLAKNTALRVKLMSATLIDSLVPSTDSGSTKTKFSSDVLHVDLVTRF